METTRKVSFKIVENSQNTLNLYVSKFGKRHHVFMIVTENTYGGGLKV